MTPPKNLERSRKKNNKVRRVTGNQSRKDKKRRYSTVNKRSIGQQKRGSKTIVKPKKRTEMSKVDEERTWKKKRALKGEGRNDEKKSEGKTGRNRRTSKAKSTDTSKKRRKMSNLNADKGRTLKRQRKDKEIRKQSVSKEKTRNLERSASSRRRIKPQPLEYPKKPKQASTVEVNRTKKTENKRNEGVVRNRQSRKTNNEKAKKKKLSEKRKGKKGKEEEDEESEEEADEESGDVIYPQPVYRKCSRGFGKEGIAATFPTLIDLDTPEMVQFPQGADNRLTPGQRISAIWKRGLGSDPDSDIDFDADDFPPEL